MLWVRRLALELIHPPRRRNVGAGVWQGFDMTTQEGSGRFIGFYNAALENMAAETGFPPAPGKPRKTKPAKKRKPGGKRKKKKKKRRR